MNLNIDAALENLNKRVKHKAKLYDGLNSVIGTDDAIRRFLFSIVEETGEIASAMIRDRWILAREECIDVAHSAILLYLAIDEKLKEKEQP